MTAIAAPGSTVLRMVGNRMSVLNIEVETGWHQDRIRELAEEEGFSFEPTTGRFFRASHISAGTGEAGDSTDAHEAAAQSPAVPADQTVTGTGGDPAAVAVALAPAPVPHVVEVAPVQELTPPAPAPTATPTTPTVVEVEALTSPPTSTTVTDPSALIAAGLADSDEKIGDLAHKARVSLERLAQAFVERESRSEALAEVARLEEEQARVAQLLTDARRAAGIKSATVTVARAPKFRPKPKTLASGATSAQVREWAAANGVECPRVGIVPRRVIDAYLDAHEDVA